MTNLKIACCNIKRGGRPKEGGIWQQGASTMNVTSSGAKGSCLIKANSIFPAKGVRSSTFVHSILAITGNCPRFRETTELPIKMGVEIFLGPS